MRDNILPINNVTSAIVQNVDKQYGISQGYDNNDCGPTSFTMLSNILTGSPNAYTQKEVLDVFNERSMTNFGRLTLPLGLEAYHATPPWAYEKAANDFLSDKGIPYRAVWVQATEEQLVQWVEETGNPVSILIETPSGGYHWIDFIGGDSATQDYVFLDPTPYGNNYIDSNDPDYSTYLQRTMNGYNSQINIPIHENVEINLQNECIVFVDEQTYNTLPTTTNTPTVTNTPTETQTPSPSNAATETPTQTLTPTPSQTTTPTSSQTATSNSTVSPTQSNTP